MNESRGTRAGQIVGTVIVVLVAALVTAVVLGLLTWAAAEVWSRALA